MSKKLKSRRELMLEELHTKMKPLIFDLYMLSTPSETEDAPIANNDKQQTNSVGSDIHKKELAR